MIKRIIIVDDEAQLRSLYVKYLAKTTDFLVDDYENPVHALEKMRSEKRNEIDYDWVFTDYEMHPFNGLDLTRKIRAEFGAIPYILVMSGREEIRSKALEAGANAFFSKPLSLANLVLLVKGLQPAQ